jgi:hypothetical protein
MARGNRSGGAAGIEELGDQVGCLGRAFEQEQVSAAAHHV